MSTIAKTNSEIREYPITRLVMDPRVQRPLEQKKVNRIAENFNPEALGIICVSLRSNGDLSIIDGQHRVAACKELGLENDLIKCEVFEGLTLSDEAAMFRLRNNTSQVQYIDKVRVRIIEGDQVALEMQKIMERHGWQIAAYGKSGDDGNLSSVRAFERIYLMDPDSMPTAVERTLDTATRAWGHGVDSVDRRIIEGMGIFYNRYRNQVNTNDMVNRLKVFAGGPRVLIGKARGLASMLGISVSRAVAEILLEQYNMRRRSSQLPPLREK